MKYLMFLGGDFASHNLRLQENTDEQYTQGDTQGIGGDTNWNGKSWLELRLEILQQILSTGESVVAGARKKAEPEVKQVKQTVPVPKTNWVKH